MEEHRQKHTEQKKKVIRTMRMTRDLRRRIILYTSATMTTITLTRCHRVLLTPSSRLFPFEYMRYNKSESLHEEGAALRREAVWSWFEGEFGSVGRA